MPRGWWHETKAEGERIVLAANDPGGLQTTSLRPAVVWGRGGRAARPVHERLRVHVRDAAVVAKHVVFGREVILVALRGGLIIDLHPVVAIRVWGLVDERAERQHVRRRVEAATEQRHAHRGHLVVGEIAVRVDEVAQQVVGRVRAPIRDQLLAAPEDLGDDLVHLVRSGTNTQPTYSVDELAHTR